MSIPSNLPVPSLKRAWPRSRAHRLHATSVRGNPLARVCLLFAFTLLLGLGAGVVPLDAQVASPSELREQIQSAYEVLPVAEGVLLRPLSENRGVRSIELSGNRIAVNGERVSASVLRAWLDDAAEPLLALAALDSSDRRALFDLPAIATSSAPAAQAQAASGESEDPEPSASSEASEQVEPAQDPEAGEEIEAPEAPAEPEAPRRSPEKSTTTHLGSSFTVGETVVVEEGESRKEVTVSGGSLIVRGRVERNATVFSGTAEIDGEVGGDVVAIGGSVVLGPDAEVDGDVTSVLGSVTRDPGAWVGGDISELSMVGPAVRELIRDRGLGRVDLDDFGVSRRGWRPVHRLTDFLFDVFSWIVIGLIVLLAVFLARGPIERIEMRFAAEPVRALVAGFLACLFFFPLLLIVIVVLAVSIIGIPVLIFLVLFMVFVFPFLVVILGLIGYLGIAKSIGHYLGRRFEWSLTPYTATLVGAGSLWSFLLISNFLSIFGGPIDFFTAMFAIVGFVLNMFAVLAGLGTWLLILVDGRRNRAVAVVPPPPNSDGWHGADPEQDWREPGARPETEGYPAADDHTDIHADVHEDAHDEAWNRDSEPDPPWEDEATGDSWDESTEGATEATDGEESTEPATEEDEDGVEDDRRDRS